MFFFFHFIIIADSQSKWRIIIYEEDSWAQIYKHDYSAPVCIYPFLNSRKKICCSEKEKTF